MSDLEILKPGDRFKVVNFGAFPHTLGKLGTVVETQGVNVRHYLDDADGYIGTLPRRWLEKIEAKGESHE